MPFWPLATNTLRSIAILTFTFVTKLAHDPASLGEKGPGRGPVPVFRGLRPFILAIALGGCAADGTQFSSLSGLLPFLPISKDTIAVPEAPPENLTGADRSVVARQLGQPELVRHEGTAEIWHYSGDQCRLLVFLYAEGDSAQVRFVDVWPQNRDARQCLASVSHRLVAGAPSKGVMPASYP